MISIEGVEKLLELHKQGKPLPETWEQDLKEYIERKRYAVRELNSEARQLRLAELISKLITKEREQ